MFLLIFFNRFCLLEFVNKTVLHDLLYSVFNVPLFDEEHRHSDLIVITRAKAGLLKAPNAQNAAFSLTEFANSLKD